MQPIWILQYKSEDDTNGVAVFASSEDAQKFIEGSVDSAGVSGIAITRAPFEFGLEGVTAETYLHQALRAVFQLPTSRESSLVKTKIQEAQLWLGVTDQEIAQVPG